MRIVLLHVLFMSEEERTGPLYFLAMVISKEYYKDISNWLFYLVYMSTLQPRISHATSLIL